MPSAAQGSIPAQGSAEWIFQSIFGVNGAGAGAGLVPPGGGADAPGTTTESVQFSMSDVPPEFASMMAGGGENVAPMAEELLRHMNAASTGESLFTTVPQADGSSQIFVSSFTLPDMTMVPPPPGSAPPPNTDNPPPPPSESQDGA